jgi:hypothetical protein
VNNSAPVSRCFGHLLAVATLAILAHHPSASARARPAHLELTETLPGRYDVVWRTPVLAGMRPRRSAASRGYESPRRPKVRESYPTL